MSAPTIGGLQSESRLEVRHGTTPAELQTLIKPLFLWMYDHGVKDLSIARDGKKALITVDRQPSSEAHPDDAAVDRFAERMKHKLCKARERGRSGWQDRTWTPERISHALREHVEKGDPTDVANYCMFLAARNEVIAPRSTFCAEDDISNLLEAALRAGVVITVERRSLQPLAMGHAEYVIETRPVRGAA